MSYFLAPALEQLRAQINAAHPDRDKASDGWIGDTSHQARPSDHNPAPPDGIVRAYDLDEDLVIGMTVVGEAQPLADALVRDPRTRYVIYEGRICYGAHVTGVVHGWQPYTGPNAHRHHIHISVRSTGGHDRDARPWALPGTITTPTPEDDMPTAQEIAAELVKTLPAAVWGHRFQATEADGQKIPSETAGERVGALRKHTVQANRRAGDSLILTRAIAKDAGAAVDVAAFSTAVVARLRTDLTAAIAAAIAAQPDRDAAHIAEAVVDELAGRIAEEG
ncbi:hypothetical protein [Promicromonospora sp. NPDC023805]|uniref:hypothetical protein n=1 Tax=Promicromonospora sp. NPDC023805 TaxID=3154696 RepID=UPI0033C8754C